MHRFVCSSLASHLRHVALKIDATKQCVCVYLALVETLYSATYLPTVESCCWQRLWQSAVYQFIYHAD